MLAELNKILNTFEQNWEPSARGKQEWLQSYFLKSKIINLTLTEQLLKLKEFYRSDLSEESFKTIFKDKIVMTKPYESPLEYNKQLKQIEIKKIAFNISNFINLDFQKSFLLCQRLYMLYSIDKWTSDTFMILLNDYDPKLKLKLILEEKIAA